MVEGMKRSPTRLNHCQYLLVTPVNHTLTNFADHTENMRHDAINRMLLREHLTPQLVWDNVGSQVEMSARGYHCLTTRSSIKVTHTKFNWSGVSTVATRMG
jgi:hypothetical protein